VTGKELPKHGPLLISNKKLNSFVVIPAFRNDLILTGHSNLKLEA